MSNKKTIAIITNNIDLSLLLKEQFDLQGIFSLKLFNEKSIDLFLKKNENILAFIIAEDLLQTLKAKKNIESFWQRNKKITILISKNETEHDVVNDIRFQPLYTITLPIEFRALTKLLSDIVQQKEKPRFSNVDLGNIFLDVVGRKIHKHEKSAKLTEKESKILWYLLSNPNLKIDKKLLLKEIWGYTEKIETRTLTTHIYRIRQKFLEIGEDGYEISNIENSYILKTG
ncbi:MAG: winged helix-turn-helix domain-containing protein [Pseudomonadota bacterium]|nr:winged helix-turn-helix domain-containing protein [Pseudomonadota bacterium]